MFALKQKLNWFCHIENGDPFADLLLLMCGFRLFPYENIRDAKHHKLSNKTRREMQVMHVLSFVVTARLLGIVFVDHPTIRYYLFEYLSYEDNQRQFFLALSALFVSLSLICK